MFCFNGEWRGKRGENEKKSDVFVRSSGSSVESLGLFDDDGAAEEAEADEERDEHGDVDAVVLRDHVVRLEEGVAARLGDGRGRARALAVPELDDHDQVQRIPALVVCLIVFRLS